jgi:hypothetical protein
VFGHEARRTRKSVAGHDFGVNSKFPEQLVPVAGSRQVGSAARAVLVRYTPC